MMSPSSSFAPVRALNCLQNSMMLICAWPSAGPTGGAGVALPAAICNFTKPVTFFAIIFLQAKILAYDLLNEFGPSKKSQHNSWRKPLLHRIGSQPEALDAVSAQHFHLSGLRHYHHIR